MGEIRSTLDLVLEKTRHLTLSTDEKRVEREARASALIKGLLQKHADGAMRLEEMLAAYRKLRLEQRLEHDALFISEVLDQVDLDSDDGRRLKVLSAVCGREAVRRLEATIAAAREELKRAGEEADRDAREALQRNRRISGSAVVIERERSAAFRKRKAELNARLKAGFERFKAHHSAARGGRD
jgi:hypothetical protein